MRKWVILVLVINLALFALWFSRDPEPEPRPAAVGHLQMLPATDARSAPTEAAKPAVEPTLPTPLAPAPAVVEPPAVTPAPVEPTATPVSAPVPAPVKPSLPPPVTSTPVPTVITPPPGMGPRPEQKMETKASLTDKPTPKTQVKPEPKTEPKLESKADKAADKKDSRTPTKTSKIEPPPKLDDGRPPENRTPRSLATTVKAKSQDKPAAIGNFCRILGPNSGPRSLQILAKSWPQAKTELIRQEQQSARGGYKVMLAPEEGFQAAMALIEKLGRSGIKSYLPPEEINSFRLQAGYFQQEKNARDLVERLKTLGFDSTIEQNLKKHTDYSLKIERPGDEKQLASELNQLLKNKNMLWIQISPCL